MTESESIVYEYLTARHHDVYKGGWPDFYCVNRNAAGRESFFCVEVKLGDEEVREQQKRCHELLWRAGIPTQVIRVRKDDSIADIDSMYTRQTGAWLPGLETCEYDVNRISQLLDGLHRLRGEMLVLKERIEMIHVVRETKELFVPKQLIEYCYPEDGE